MAEESFQERLARARSALNPTPPPDDSAEAQDIETRLARARAAQGDSGADTGPVSGPVTDTMPYMLTPGQVADTGAESAARRDVGGAPSPQDRLATLRQYYPDAQPYGEDNFIFTDPKTGKVTIYNPVGLDWGDVSSLRPEIYEMFGGGLGASAGTIAGGPFGAAAGAGVGALTAKQIENADAVLRGKRVDTRDLVDRGIDMASTAVTNSVMQRTGDLAATGLQKGRQWLFGTGPDAAKRLADFDFTGVSPSAGAVTGSKVFGMTEKALSYAPGSTRDISRLANEQLDQLKEGTLKLGSQFAKVGSQAGEVRSPEDVGQILKQASASAGRRFADRREILDQAVSAKIGPNTMVPISNAQQLLGDLAIQLNKAPDSLKPAMKPAIDTLKNLIGDAKNGLIPFEALRTIRTQVGMDLAAPDVSGYVPKQQQYIEKVYNALKDDIKDAARSYGAEKELATHDRYVTFHRNDQGQAGKRIAPLDRLERIAKAEGGAEAWKKLLAGADLGGEKLAQLRRSIRPEEWDDVAASVLGSLGKAKPAQQGATEVGGTAGFEMGDFSVNTFLTNWNKLSKEARTALFAGTRYENLVPALNSLVRTTSYLKEVDKLGNPSGTGRQLLTASVFTALTGAAGYAVTGDFSEAAGLTTTAVLAPKAAAKLITNPRFVRWLANTSSQKSGSVTASLARLAGISVAEPEISDEIKDLMGVISENAPPANVGKRLGDALDLPDNMRLPQNRNAPEKMAEGGYVDRPRWFKREYGGEDDAPEPDFSQPARYAGDASGGYGRGSTNMNLRLPIGDATVTYTRQGGGVNRPIARDDLLQPPPASFTEKAPPSSLPAPASGTFQRVGVDYGPFSSSYSRLAMPGGMGTRTGYGLGYRHDIGDGDVSADYSRGVDGGRALMLRLTKRF